MAMTARVDSLIQSAEKDLQGHWASLEERCHLNFERILDGFLHNGLSENHFNSVSGYGHNDLGREVTDAIFAHAFQAEAALVRLQMVSGTHAIATALRGIAYPGQDKLIALTGAPYDTLETVIGIRDESPLSLMRQGIGYDQIDVLDTGVLRLELTEQEQNAIRQATVGLIQRSRGYSAKRPSLTMSDIKSLIDAARSINPSLKIVVDNCYGEFVGVIEPPAVGADLIAGSLIKNPGGGIVPTGGYVAGKAKWVAVAADSLTAPGIGAEGGYTFELTRTLLQGLYFAPTVVKEALKGMSLVARVFQELGYEVIPSTSQAQADIIQVLHLKDAETVLAFCRVLQSVSPVDSRLTPIPDVTPGYADPVVMAGGTFIFGSTIELSADAPMRPPYALFLQGGLTYTHVRYATKRILETLLTA
jgi:cystathionine beta-lyase family protein involved in aluminum resistance